MRESKVSQESRTEARAVFSGNDTLAHCIVNYREPHFKKLLKNLECTPEGIHNYCSVTSALILFIYSLGNLGIAGPTKGICETITGTSMRLKYETREINTGFSKTK